MGVMRLLRRGLVFVLVCAVGWGVVGGYGGAVGGGGSVVWGANNRGRIIEFGEYHWNVTLSDHLVHNRWSNGRQSVWVDDRHRLHLRLRQVDGQWYAAQVKSLRSFGYGDYRFQVATNTEGLDQNINMGMFVYKNMPSGGQHEIDIELTRFDETHKDAPTAHYTVQPYEKDGNVERFKMGLNGGYSTHRFVWKEDSILYQSYHGHGNSIRDLPPKERLMHEWRYTGPDIPKPADEKLYLNLFLWRRGAPPTDAKEAEVIIHSVEVLPIR